MRAIIAIILPMFICICAVYAENRSVTINDRYFELVPFKGSWDQAKKDAESRGGRLACVKTAELNDAVYNSLVKPSTLCAIYFGGHKMNDKWMWVDGSEMTFTNWQPKGHGQPQQPNSSSTAIKYQAFTELDLPNQSTWNNVPNNRKYSESGYLFESVAGYSRDVQSAKKVTANVGRKETTDKKAATIKRDIDDKKLKPPKPITKPLAVSTKPHVKRTATVVIVNGSVVESGGQSGGVGNGPERI